MIKASDVKELRERTGAGMMDCKKALTETNGDMEKAIDWLREKGIAKAAKKESRIAAEGLTEGASNDDEAIIFEVNCETDFVTKNESFQGLVKELRDALMFSDAKTLEEANEVKLKSGKTIAETIVDATAKIGEKISFRRFERITKGKDEVFGIYSHMGGKITSIVTLKGTDRDVARDVAMHVAAMNPISIDKDGVPEDTLNREKEVIKETIKNDEKNKNKPDDIIDKMSIGKLNKFYKENCLIEQEFVKDSDLTVGQFVKNNNSEVTSMIRYAVGEGIEKRKDDFAEEVMSQINNS